MSGQNLLLDNPQINSTYDLTCIPWSLGLDFEYINNRFYSDKDESDKADWRSNNKKVMYKCVCFSILFSLYYEILLYERYINVIVNKVA